MTELTQTPPPADTRDEKLRAIAAVFGEAVAARIGAGGTRAPVAPADPDRLAWQTNRLIRHLREREVAGAAAPQPAASPAPDAPAPTHARAFASLKGHARVPVLVAGEDLAAEHPAVIAHVLKDECQQVRVSVLRALPGHVARAVIRRLRTVV